MLQAQQELETEGLKGEFDRTQATQTLETTLDKLLDHLEEKDVQDPEQQTAGVQRASDPTRGSPSLAPKQPGNQAACGGARVCPSSSYFIYMCSRCLFSHPRVDAHTKNLCFEVFWLVSALSSAAIDVSVGDSIKSVL